MLKIYTEMHLKASRQMPQKSWRQGKKQRDIIAHYYRLVRKDQWDNDRNSQKKAHERARERHYNQVVNTSTNARLIIKNMVVST